MADLALELEHLSEANRHISEAEARINALAQRLRNGGSSSSLEQTSKLLKTMEEILATFQQHRAFILSTISELERSASR